MKKLKRRQLKEIVRFGEYWLSGNAQFWSGYAAFAVLDAGFGVGFWVAKSVAYFFGITVNFVLERFWVFRQKRISKKQIQTTAGRFYFLMFVNFVLDLAIVGGLREIGITPYIGQFISAGFFTVWNWVLFKLWVFARNRSPARHNKHRSKPVKSKGRVKRAQA